LLRQFKSNDIGYRFIVGKPIGSHFMFMPKRKRISWADAMLKVKDAFENNPDASIRKISDETGISWETVKLCIGVLIKTNAIQRKRWIRCYVLNCEDSDCGHEIISPIGESHAMYCPVCMYISDQKEVIKKKGVLHE
jgi:hypothetical protein